MLEIPAVEDTPAVVGVPELVETGPVLRPEIGSSLEVEFG